MKRTYMKTFQVKLLKHLAMIYLPVNVDYKIIDVLFIYS